MGTNDLTLRVADGMFNYRVGAVIIDAGEVLMVRNNGDSHYYTVGGRIQFGESAQEAILREAFEETQIELEIDRLAFIHENFFTMGSSGKPFHELCFFFLLKQNKRLREMKHDFFEEAYGDVLLHWLPLDKLENYPMYPLFFKTELLNLPNRTKYLITRDDITVQVM